MLKSDITQTTAARFWARVHKTSTCWLWTGALWRGYGRFWYNVGGKCIFVKAHRFAFDLAGDPLGQNREGDHYCPNKCCVRIHPDHVVAVPRHKNHDSPTYLNRLKTRCDAGHQLTGKNLYRDASGSRLCRECRKLNARAYRKRLGLGAGRKPQAVCKRGHSLADCYREKRGRYIVRHCKECHRIKVNKYLSRR